jgi:hypothetical protein
MKGYIFDENLPTRLRFLPGLPVVPLAKILRFGNLGRKEFHAVLARLWPQIETLLRTRKLVNVYDGFLEGIG